MIKRLKCACGECSAQLLVMRGIVPDTIVLRFRAMRNADVYVKPEDLIEAVKSFVKKAPKEITP